VSAASDLLSNYQHVIEDLRFVMGEKGIFDVTVDGDLLYSKHASGRHAEPGEVLSLFRDAYAADVAVYGT